MVSENQQWTNLMCQKQKRKRSTHSAWACWCPWRSTLVWHINQSPLINDKVTKSDSIYPKAITEYLWQGYICRIMFANPIPDIRRPIPCEWKTFTAKGEIENNTSNCYDNSVWKCMEIMISISTWGESFDKSLSPEKGMFDFFLSIRRRFFLLKYNRLIDIVNNNTHQPIIVNNNTYYAICFNIIAVPA